MILTKINPLYQVIFITCIWKTLQNKLGDKFFTLLVPSSFRDYFNEKKRNDDILAYNVATNSTGCIHSLIVTPFCLIEGLRLWGINPYTEESMVMEVIGRLMLAYFIWDFIECFVHLKIHGWLYLLHAIFSISGLSFQLLAKNCRMLGVIAMVAGCEISTPFLHIRWLYLKADMTNTKHFKFISLLGIIFFIGYRLFFLPWIIFPSVIKEMFFMTHSYDINLLRRCLMIMALCLSAFLNYMWAVQYLKTYFKRKSRSKAM